MTEFETQINGEILKIFISIQFKCAKQNVYNNSINSFLFKLAGFDEMLLEMGITGGLFHPFHLTPAQLYSRGRDCCVGG